MKIIKLALLVGAFFAANLQASDEQFKSPESSQGSFYARRGNGATILEPLPNDSQRAASVLWQRIQHVVTTNQQNAFVEKLPNLIKDYKEPLADALLYVPDKDGIYVERTLLQQVRAAMAYAENEDDNDAIFFYNDIILALEGQKAHAPNKPAKREVDGKKIATQRLGLQQKANNPDSQANTGTWKAVLKGGLVLASLALVGVALYFGIPYLKNRRTAPAKAGS